MNKVLLIESDADSSAALSNFLTAHGYNVNVVNDGGVALQYLSHNQVHIIIMAAELPRGNGYSICNRLRKDPQAPQIPLIIISGNPAADSTFAQHQKLRTHADLYMKKPIKLDILLNQMHELIAESHQATLHETPTIKPSEAVAPAPLKRRLTSSQAAELEQLVGMATAVHKVPQVIMEKSRKAEATAIASPNLMAQVFAEERTVTSAQPATDDSATLRKENRDLKAKIKQLEQALQAREENSKEELANANDQYNVVMQKLTQLAEKAKALIAERDELTQQLAQSTNNGHGAQEEITTLEEKLAAAQATIAEHYSNNAALAAERDQLAKQVEELTAALKQEKLSSSNSSQEWQKALDAGKQQVLSLNEEISGLESRLTNERLKGEKAQKALHIAMQIIEESGAC